MQDTKVPQGVSEEKWNALTRFQRRAALRSVAHAAGINRAPGSSRVRSGIPTGTTSHFRMWMADLSTRSALQRLKLNTLAENTEGRLARGLALLYVGGVKNVLDLSQARVEDMLDMQGIGIATLDVVEKYLLERQVTPRWTVS